MGRQFAKYYYDFFLGLHPSEENFTKTANTFDYLLDGGLSNKEVWKIMQELPYLEVVTPEDLPEELWNNSLIERDKFYYHKELQVTSPPPTWDKTFPFFLEMKIKYTLDDALDYFIKRSSVREEWVNREKEIGSIKYLVKNYAKFKFMEPLDFLLHLIDYAVSDGAELNKLYDICNYEIEVAKYLEVDTANATANDKNVVVWRS